MSVTISNPPYNMKWEHPFFASSQNRFNLGLPPESNANFAFILSSLENSYQSIFLLPNRVLSPTQKDENNIVKNLVDKNILECVISLPGSMFESTSIPTSILVFNKKKETHNYKMIDLTEKVIKEERLQNGQFGKTNTKRTYKKEVNVLSDEIIKQVLDFLQDDVVQEDFMTITSKKEIVKQDYNLSPKRYIEVNRGSDARRLEDVVCDLNRIIKKKSSVKITVNEKVANSLGIVELANLMNGSDDLSESTAELLKPFDLKIEKQKMMSLSKYKEFKIEVMDFENLPEIISLFMNMWKQAIMMLNNEENRLLVELRDILLVKLMSGELKIKED